MAEEGERVLLPHEKNVCKTLKRTIMRIPLAFLPSSIDRIKNEIITLLYPRMLVVIMKRSDPSALFSVKKKKEKRKNNNSTRRDSKSLTRFTGNFGSRAIRRV